MILLISEWYKFGCRHQKESESIADFVADLRKLAARCNFKKASLDETFRDKFMCGLQHEYIRSRLLTEEDNLTLDRSVEIATGLGFDPSKLNHYILGLHSKKIQNKDMSSNGTHKHF